MIRQLIRRLANGENLGRNEMDHVMEEILNGQASPPQTAAFLMALRLKGRNAGRNSLLRPGGGTTHASDAGAP